MQLLITRNLIPAVPTLKQVLIPLLLLGLVNGCASDNAYLEDETRPYTHPLAGCNAYPPVAHGVNDYHRARDYIDCPEPLPALTSTGGGERANKVVLTAELIRKLRLTPEQLSQLQFYNSERIILQRELAGGDQFVQNGRLVTRDGRHTEKVVVERGTAGVATRISGNAIAVDFGQGTAMQFGLMPNRTLYNPLHSSYRLLAWGWDRNNTGKVNFNNQVYRAVGPSHSAALMIDQDEISRNSTTRQVLPGRTVFDNDPGYLPAPAPLPRPETDYYR